MLDAEQKQKMKDIGRKISGNLRDFLERLDGVAEDLEAVEVDDEDTDEALRVLGDEIDGNFKDDPAKREVARFFINNLFAEVKRSAFKEERKGTEEVEYG